MFYSFVFSVPILNVALIKNAECTHFKSTKYTVYSEKNTASSLSFVDYTIQNQVAPTHKVQVNFDIFLVFPTCSQKITLLLLILKLLCVSGSFCSGSLFWIHLKPFQLFFCLKGKILVNFRSGTDSCIQA